MIMGGRMKYFLIGMIRIYQMIPFSTHTLCRHVPTCSEYAIQAISKYGSIKGSKMAIKRILNCRKGGTYGYDPVR